MKASELKKKSVEELNTELNALLKKQFQYRMQRSTGLLNQTHLQREVRRDIARLRTVLRDKQDK